MNYYNPLRNNRYLFILFGLFCALNIMSGCANRPEKMHFSPSQPYGLAAIYHNQTASVSVDDQRKRAHLLKIITDDQQKQSIGAISAITLPLQQTLAAGFSQQGLTINAGYPNTQIHLSVIQLEGIVKQNNFDYQAEFVVEMKLTVEKGQQRFYKTFTGNGANEGILRHDLARMEQELNQLTAAVLSRIFNDQDVIQALTQAPTQVR